MSAPAGFPDFNPANGEYYRIQTGTDSHGDPGTWHIYQDGHKVFIAATQPVSSSGGVAAPTPPPPPPVVVSQSPQPITSAPAPPAPVVVSQSPQPITGSGSSTYNGPGGTAAPQPPAPSPAPIAPVTGGTAAPQPVSAGQSPQSNDNFSNMPYITNGNNPLFPGMNNNPNGSQRFRADPIIAGGLNGNNSSSSGTSDNQQSNTSGDSGSNIPGSVGGNTSASAPASSSGSSAASGGTSATTGSGSPAPASDNSGGGTHTVVHGDTMWGIAQANHMPLSQLEALNPQIQNPNLIFPGQQVNLGSGGGGAAADPASASGGSTYTVTHGDTLSGIAASNGISLHQLESLNPQIKNPDLIFPGQQVNLGSGGASAPAGSTDGTNATQSSVVFPKTSTYQSAGSVSQADETSSARASGWANGTGNVPADPAKGIIEAVSKTETDPLKIKDDKPHTA